MYSRASGVLPLDPMRLRPALAIGFVVLALVGAGGLAGFAHRELERTVPHGKELARGVRIEGREIPPNTDPAAFIGSLADAELDRAIDVRYEDDLVFTATPRELGATVDTEWVLSHALRVARKGDAYDRY